MTPSDRVLLHTLGRTFLPGAWTPKRRLGSGGRRSRWIPRVTSKEASQVGACPRNPLLLVDLGSPAANACCGLGCSGSVSIVTLTQAIGISQDLLSVEGQKQNLLFTSPVSEDARCRARSQIQNYSVPTTSQTQRNHRALIELSKTLLIR